MDVRERLLESVEQYLKDSHQTYITLDAFKALVEDQFGNTISDDDIVRYYKFTFTDDYDISSKYCLGLRKTPPQAAAMSPSAKTAAEAPLKL